MQMLDVVLPSNIRVAFQLDQPVSIHINPSSLTAVIEGKRLITGSTNTLQTGVALTPDALRALVACLKEIEQHLNLSIATEVASPTRH